MKNFAALSLAVAVGLSLSACSAQEAPEASPEPSVEASATASAPVSESPSEEAPVVESKAVGEYAFATGMTFGKVTTSGEPGKELKEFLDAAAETAGESYEDQLTFWTVKIDNRQGTDNASANALRVYDDAGNEYLFASAIDVIEAVNDELPDAPEDATEDSPEWQEYQHLYDLYSAAFEAEDFTAHPGAVKEFVVISGDKLPEDFAKITIDLGGMVGEADVIPLEEAESQGYPLDF